MLATGLQQGVGNDLVFPFDDYRKDIVDVLTVRATHLACQAHVAAASRFRPTTPILTQSIDVLNSTLASEIQDGEA